jgi:arylsulfatase A-like enzyme
MEKKGLTKTDAGPGEAVDEHGRPYKPIQLDLDCPPAKEKRGKPKKSQGDEYGRLLVPPDTTTTAFTAMETLEAIGRAHKSGKPFSITCSLCPPHPPMVVPDPFYSRFPAAGLLVPESLTDPMVDSPYAARALQPLQQRLYRNPQNVREMKQIYYGMVADTDLWVGRLLQRLDELGMTDNTLVVFTSDHGEMLGDHGMNSKFVFYEGSAHVPLLLRMPGAIPAGKRVAAPVSQCDLFPSILDYLGRKSSPCDGRSLRNAIEGRSDPIDFAVSEWAATKKTPTVMIRDARYKLMTTHLPNAPNCDALYDLANDPAEMHNLIGPSAKVAKHSRSPTT